MADEIEVNEIEVPETVEDVVEDTPAPQPERREPPASKTDEDPVDVMTRHLRDHPENTAADLADVMNVLVPGTTGKDERVRVAEAAIRASDHPLKGSLSEVRERL